MEPDALSTLVQRKTQLEAALEQWSARLAGLDAMDPRRAATIALAGLAALADGLANYFEAFGALVRSFTTTPIASWREFVVSPQTAWGLLCPNHASRRCVGLNRPGAERLWDVVVAYCYFGSTYTAGSSVFSYLAVLEGLLETMDAGDPSDVAEVWELVSRPMSDPHFVVGLRAIATRARFLSEVDDDELASRDVDWWLDRPDFYPPRFGLMHGVQYHLDRCPDPSDPRVLERLRVIAGDLEMSEEVRTSASWLIERRSVGPGH